MWFGLWLIAPVGPSLPDFVGDWKTTTSGLEETLLCGCPSTENLQGDEARPRTCEPVILRAAHRDEVEPVTRKYPEGRR